MFLKKAYSQNKFLFYVIILFCMGQLFFMYKGVENTPFFLYGMYSAKQFPQEEYPVSIVEIDGKEFNYENLPHASHEMIVASLEHYRSLEQTDFQDTIMKTIEKRFGNSENFQIIAQRLTNDSTDRIPYQQWLKKYLGYVTGDGINELKVYAGYFSYEPRFRLIRKELLFEVK